MHRIFSNNSVTLLYNWESFVRKYWYSPENNPFVHETVRSFTVISPDSFIIIKNHYLKMIFDKKSYRGIVSISKSPKNKKLLKSFQNHNIYFPILVDKSYRYWYDFRIFRWLSFPILIKYTIKSSTIFNSFGLWRFCYNKISNFKYFNFYKTYIS